MQMNPRNHSIPSSSSRWQQVMQQCDHSKLEEQREGGVPEHHIHIVFLDCFSDILDGGFRQIQVGVIANMKQQEKKS